MAEKVPESLVLLAGGKGERAGVPKGLLSFQGQSLLAIQLERARRLGLSHIILGLGFFAERYEEEVARLARDKKHVTMVVNPEPELGQFRTLQEALRQSPGDAFVLPLDTPLPHRPIFDALRGKGRAALPEINGRGGHPVWLAHDFVRYLTALSPHDADARLDHQLHHLGRDCARIPVGDARILLNVNTREEWEKSARLFTQDEALPPQEAT